jgi:outer membrane immunogenic protein
MPLKAPPPPPACDWCGFYLGVNVGADRGRSSVTPSPGFPFAPFEGIIPPGITIISPAQLATLPGTGGHAVSIIGGGQAGYNWQVGHVVYGIEADVDGDGLREKSSSTLTRTTLSGTQTVTANFSANVDWTASLRGRLGYASDHSLLYVTGGLAVAGMQFNTAYSIVEPVQPPPFAPIPGMVSDPHALGGWTVGAGGEWLFNKNWSAGLEYRHSDYGNRGFNAGYSDLHLSGLVTATTAQVHFADDQVTARLNYHFH